MSEILNHPFYKASKELYDQILNEVDLNLSTLSNTYLPAESDRDLFLPYGNKYVLLNMMNYYHHHFFYDIGNSIIEKIAIHEERIGIEICKESVFAIMSMCAISKNDVLNYRIFLEKMIDQRKLYNTTNVSLINLINSIGVFGTLQRESNRVFNSNSIIATYQKTAYFSDLTYTITASNLSSFHQNQFIIYIQNYRLLHFSLNNTSCPAIIYENCYTLIQNLCVLIESNLKEKKSSTNLFNNLLTTDISEPYKSILSTTLNLRTKYPTNNIASFNINFPLIVNELETCINPDEIICYCLYIAYMCRNQVMHNVNDNIVFHNNGQLTEKLIGILLSAINFTDKV